MRGRSVFFLCALFFPALLLGAQRRRPLYLQWTTWCAQELRTTKI